MAKPCGSCGASTPQFKPAPQRQQAPRSSSKTITNVQASGSRFGTPKVKFSFRSGKK